MGLREAETQKIISLEGSNFKIKKLSPDIVVPWVLKVEGKASGALLKSVAGGAVDFDSIAKVLEEFLSMSKSQYVEFKQDFGSGVFYQYGDDRGFVRIFDEFGNYTISDINPIVLHDLLIHSFMFNISGFFTKERLERLVSQSSNSMKSILPTAQPQDAQPQPPVNTP